MNLSKLLFSLLCLYFAFLAPVSAQSLDGCCITISSGVCNAVGGPSNIYASQINWTLMCTEYGSVIMYDYRMGICDGSSTVSYGYPSMTNGGFTFAVIDTSSGNIWFSYNPDTNATAPAGNQFGQYGNIHCTAAGNPQNGFDFLLTGNHPYDSYSPLISSWTWAKTISTFLDSIPNGYLVLMYTVSEPQYRNIDTNLVNQLAAMGATDLRNLCIDTGAAQHIPVPYIFWTVKGDSSWGGQAIGSTYDSLLTVNFCLPAQNTQVSDISPATDFHIYPNPSSGDFTLTSATSYIGSPISIFDCVGRKVMSADITKESESIDMGNLPAGIYILTIGQSTYKLALVK